MVDSVSSFLAISSVIPPFMAIIRGAFDAMGCRKWVYADHRMGELARVWAHYTIPFPDVVPGAFRCAELWRIPNNYKGISRF